jgi:hypothetical protein
VKTLMAPLLSKALESMVPGTAILIKRTRGGRKVSFEDGRGRESVPKDEARGSISVASQTAFENKANWRVP